MSSRVHPATQAVRAALESDTQYGAVVPPLHLSSNFTFSGFGEKRQYDYSRSGNPTRDALADALTALESGAGGVVTSSGMAALTLVVQLLEPGDLLVAPHDCYGGSYRLFENLAARGHFDVAFIDQTDERALAAACERQPRLILVETPSNPLLRIVDIAAVAAQAKACGALLAVDNTFLSPALQNPLTLGADLVVHSTTKYLNGHSDVVGGAVVAGTEELAETLAWWSNCLGLSGAPFDSYLTLRGVRTLHTRMRQHEESASRIAAALDRHPGVAHVYYPGLEDHPQHALASRQQLGFGGMLSFEIEGGEIAVRAFVESLEQFSLAESLGGVESLVCHPASMTHAAVSREALAEAGIGESLVRLSVGLEDGDDLLADVLAALNVAQQAGRAARLAVVGGEGVSRMEATATEPECLMRHVSGETRYFRVQGAFRLESGATIESPVVAYRTWGDPANAAERTVLICHALTASADADRWWPGMIGAGAAFDPARDFIVCSNILGSCYGTTGPASRRPGSGERYRADFPRITVRDMVELQRRLLDELGVGRIALVTGPSLGGMQALEWAASYPDRVQAMAPIGVGGRHSAWCIAISEAQRAAIYADEDWRDGYYSDERPPQKGLAAARMMAVCTYRSWHGFQQRFARDECGPGGFQMESYLRHQGTKFHQRFDAVSYVRLTQAMNSHDLARGRGEYFDVLEGLEQPALIVSVSSDTLYPPFEQALLARYLPNAIHRTLDTDDGHDGFLIKTGPLGRLIAAFREDLEPAARGARTGNERLTAVAE